MSRFSLVDTRPSLTPKAYYIHTVSGQVPWSHWHAISTSLAPASLQAGPQYLSPGCARHRHGRCAHLFCSFVVIILIVLLFQPLSSLLSWRDYCGGRISHRSRLSICFPMDTSLSFRSTFVSSSIQSMLPRLRLSQRSSQPSVQGGAGCAESCHSRVLRQHRRPVSRHASLLPRYPLSNRRPRWLHEKPGELILRYVQPFFPLQFATFCSS
jgi:hypothetical protein